jgi:hypothetical protein
MRLALKALGDDTVCVIPACCWAVIPGATSSTPVIAVSDGALYLFVRGMNDGIYYKRWTESDGWGAWKAIPGATNDVPAIAVLENNLHLIVRGTDNGIYHKYMDLSTGTWSEWVNVPGVTPSTPAS